MAIKDKSAGSVPDLFDKGLRIVARPEGGFRRCRLHHPATPVDHPPGTFTVEEAGRLKAEPKLLVMEIDAPAPAAAPAPAKA